MLQWVRVEVGWAAEVRSWSSVTGLLWALCWGRYPPISSPPSLEFPLLPRFPRQETWNYSTCPRTDPHSSNLSLLLWRCPCGARLEHSRTGSLIAGKCLEGSLVLELAVKLGGVKSSDNPYRGLLRSPSLFLETLSWVQELK